MKKLSLLLFISALGGVGWYSYNQQWFGIGARQTATPLPNTATALVGKHDIESSVLVSGDVQPLSQLDVKPEVGGRILKLNVIPGVRVKTGDVLVQIDDRDILTERDSAMAEIEGMKLSVDKARKNFERAKDLFAQKLLSKEAFDNLESEFLISENALTRAERKKQIVEDKLSKTKVIAPGDGTVLTAPVVEGQVVIPAASVNSGTTLMTIANLSRLLVETHVNQADVAKLALKQDVKLSAESIKDEEMDAEIFFIAPVATLKNNVKGFTVQALIDKPNARLRPGMTVQLNIPVARAEDVVAVPVSAVFRSEGNSRVVYVLAGDKTERREVKVGISNTEHAQILKGVAEGEKILLNEPERVPRKRS